MIADIKKAAEQKMQKSLEALKADLGKVRTGRAHTGLLDHINVDYYGTPMPINQVANINLIDARTIGVSPWEKKMLARRDAALGALSDAPAAAKYLARMEQGAAARRESLLELELQLGMDSPAEFQQNRLALQVKKLKDRFSSAASSGALSAGERLVAWCAQPGVADALDRQRSERIVSRVETAR